MYWNGQGCLRTYLLVSVSSRYSISFGDITCIFFVSEQEGTCLPKREPKAPIAPGFRAIKSVIQRFGVHLVPKQQ